MVRASTPPILHDPIVDEDEDETDVGWYYDEDAGGYVLTFGRHYGQKIHATSLSYLYWCDREFKNRNHPVVKAFAKFLDGLEEYATTNYGDFRVPFGRKHQGKRISECRDKKWLLWTCTKEVLTEKYPVFFTALERWLENPHHQGIKRDIGELLHASEYEDDLDLNGGVEYDDEEPTQSDLDFIDDSGVQDAESGSDDISESTGVAQYCQSDAEEAVGTETSATEDDSEDDTGPGSRCSTPPPPPRKTWNKARRTALSAGDSFIVKDDDDDGSDDYEDPDSEPAVPTPMRVTRSSAKKETLKKVKAASATSPSVSGARYRRRVRVSSTTSASSSDSVSIVRSALRRARKNIVRSTSEGDGETDQPDGLPFDPHTPPSRSKSPPTTRSSVLRSTRLGKQRAGASSSLDDVPSLTRSPRRRARRNVVDSSSDADDQSDVQDAPTFNISHLLAKKAGLKVRERAGSPDPFLGNPTPSDSSLPKRRLKTTSQDTSPWSDVDSDESGPVVEDPQQVSKQLRGRSCPKRGRSSDEPEPGTVSRIRLAANTATPTWKKPRVVGRFPDPFPSARPSRGDVKLLGPAVHPYVLLPRRATAAADPSPSNICAPRSGNEVGTPLPRPRPYVLLPRRRVSDIK